MKTEQFDYQLPEELIAQSPAYPRESCRMLVLHRDTGAIEHKVFSDILAYLKEGDLLVVNDTKVMPARLLGHKKDTDTQAEILLLHRAGGYEEEQGVDTSSVQYWEALVRPGRRLKPGSKLVFKGIQAEVVDWAATDGKGRRIIRLMSDEPCTLEAAIQEHGVLPLPPYIKDYQGDHSLYQTVYAHEQNSAAAPTAGLHFSEELLRQVQEKGCSLATVCLEIGLDTFRTVDEEHIIDHKIHSEYFSISEETIEAIKKTRQKQGRVIAVGTTAVRALESAAHIVGDLSEAQNVTPSDQNASDSQECVERENTSCAIHREATSLYIIPGYEFKVVDALITNFHVPRSTLLMLVSAFADHAMIFTAYEEAVAQRYRFLSFGDAMLIV